LPPISAGHHREADVIEGGAVVDISEPKMDGIADPLGVEAADSNAAQGMV